MTREEFLSLCTRCGVSWRDGGGGGVGMIFEIDLGRGGGGE